jgi:Zn-dependent peptidase ImmA (M78 family)
MGDQWAIEGEAGLLLRCAGADETELPRPALLAKRLGLRVFAVHAGALPGDASLARVGEEWRVYVRSRLPPERLGFAVAHELAEWHLRHVRDEGAEHVADRLAAAVLVPRRAFQRAARREPAWNDLAKRLRVSPVLAALRWGEVTDEPTAVVGPDAIRVRGAAWSWPPERELRRLAEARGVALGRRRWVLRAA